jgi:hypothetical protein
MGLLINNKPTSMNPSSLIKKHPGVVLGVGTLPVILGTCCLIGEILAAIGITTSIVLVSFSQARISSGRESVQIDVRNAVCSIGLGEGARHGPGSVSFGPMHFLSDMGASNASPQGVVVQDAEGTVTIVNPSDASRALEFVRWPFMLGLVCTGVTGVAILDLFRRMLRSVTRREVFTAGNIRNVNRLGILFIASSVARLLLAGWLVNRLAAFVALNWPQGNVALKSFSNGDGSGIGIGLMILVLAGVFRQGLALKEDSDLTI